MPEEKLLLTDICNELGDKGQKYIDCYVGKIGFRNIAGVLIVGDRLDLVKGELAASLNIEPVSIGNGYLYKRRLKINRYYKFDAVVISEEEVLSKDSLATALAAQLLRRI